ncbi:MAG TPA: lipid A biosynthesis lauroyl acyltransferase, partial [Pseudoxanthomonas sp.]|nr:lipid A biosynthesis lauroyl acyltransferase [Pseudoxanthomonas sp.]
MTDPGTSSRATAASPTQAGSAPLEPRQWASWLGIAVAALLARLPWALQRGLGRVLGGMLHATLRRRRRIAARNIALCFPDMAPAQREALVRSSFQELGIGLFEFARAWWGSVEPMRRDLRVDGLEHLHAAREGGRGVIVISGHFTTLEIAARLMCDHAPLAGMYRPHDQGAME